MKVDQLPDHQARITALTDTGRSLLVEAGAGSGKTSIIAGRVAVLLASGIHPKNIAAITFTEFAASELQIRIERFVNALSRGEIPKDLEIAFPRQVSTEARANLDRAKHALDQTVCTTIYGFSQVLIKPYPAEAGIDPGAEIIDPAEADLAFNERYDMWLRTHLSGAADDDIVSQLVIADQGAALTLIRSVADFLRHNRDAAPPACTWSYEPAKAFSAAARRFADELSRFDFQELKTEDACKVFVRMADTLGLLADGATTPSSRQLVEAVRIARHRTCFRNGGGKRMLRAKVAWVKAAEAVGRSKTEGEMCYDACVRRYDACHEAFELLMAMTASELLARLFAAMEGLQRGWSDYKRAAALLDFDDLLYTARDLLASHEPVRQALANRYRHVLVDEFQDTDPLQIDILWRLCGEASGDGNPDPLRRRLREGALFLVGDPKQAIYRFRGADVNAYVAAREAIGPEAVLEVVANFRSVAPIVDFVNDHFARPLSAAAGQPGFAALAATCRTMTDASPVVALDIVVDAEKTNTELLRDEEAKRIAELCARLVGNIEVRERDGTRPCRFGDIALLAPVGTDLWRFEEALEQRGIPVSTQAGKGFFRRQEIHDLIALTRVIADGRDTLALGALLRSPLVALTEAELLDISDALPADPTRPRHLPNLTLWTDLDHVGHDLARHVLEILQSLAKRARTTTPYMLLSDGVSRLDVHAQIAQRFRTGAERALANVDLFIEMARAYDVRGLRAFARDMQANWEDGARQVESRPDAEERSVSLITIHAAKGLEWPIVVPINMTGKPQADSGLMYNRRSGRFSIPVFGAEPGDYANVKVWNEAEQARERVRLWYVATTRARDLLVLPRHSAPLSDKCWARLVDLGTAKLPALDPVTLGPEVSAPVAPVENAQTRVVFAEEARRIAEATPSIRWQRPSLHENDEAPSEPIPVFSDPESAEAPVSAIEIAGSATRGAILHKLMEEVLTGETLDAAPELKRRAMELLAQLGQEPSVDPKNGISPKELAETIARTLSLPEIAALRPLLIPEYSVFGSKSDGNTEILVSGVADAVARGVNDKIKAIIDWKSDVKVSTHKLAAYCTQVGEYRNQTCADPALLVLMTAGRLINV